MKNKKWIVARTYICKNEDCNITFTIDEECNKKFKKKCPECKKKTLLLESADCGISTFIDMKKPNTIGGIADQNLRNAEKTGIYPEGYKKKKKPWYRKNQKVNKGILKNPGKYIETGNV